ncbi:MAG: dihydroorotase [Planctomycetes bacterium]|nr:dihydroorotase [Planctomycetota bacterium]
MSVLLQHGRILDPANGIDRVGDLLLRDGRVAGIDEKGATADRTIDVSGKIVCPGFIDLHVALREPGAEEDETTQSGTAAALAGGFTTIAAMPDTSPVVDNRAAAEFIVLQAERAGHCRVLPLGSVTKSHAGEELSEIGQLVEGGAVAFTGGKRAVGNAEIMRRALEYTRMFDRPIFNHPQVPELVAGGVMHEGYWSTRLGLRGMPAAAESIMVGRDIALAEMTGGRVHLMCISTVDSVDQIRGARRRGVRVTCDVAPHHLLLTDESVQSFDSNFKVDPPLRSAEHIAALIDGLVDGTIDAICSDHQPFAEEKKSGEIDQDPFGIVGLETLLPLCVRALIDNGRLDWPQLIEKLSAGPARVLGIPRGTLTVGADADVTVLDPEVRWTIDPSRFRSQSRNTPFAGWNVRGRVSLVFVGGRLRYEAPL